MNDGGQEGLSESVKTEEKSCYPVPDTDGVTRSVRDVPPAHYTFQIKSFSVLLDVLKKSGLQSYESAYFETGGYKWKLSLYPNGNKKSNEDGYISLYLVLAETDALPFGYVVNVSFKLFAFDQIRDKYLSVQDAPGRITRFHKLKTICGFPKLISLAEFNDASNGYLVDDSCAFGAEVFVIENKNKGECVSFLKQPIDNGIYTWRITGFSRRNENSYFSETFTIGERKWKLRLCPKGLNHEEGKSLSLFLYLDDYKTLPQGKNLYAEFNLRIKDQLDGKHLDKPVCFWFDALNYCAGCYDFISLGDFENKSQSFLAKDILVAEVHFTCMSAIIDH